MSRDRKTHGSDATDGEVADALMRAREACDDKIAREAKAKGQGADEYLRFELAEMARIEEEARQREIADEKEAAK